MSQLITKSIQEKFQQLDRLERKKLLRDASVRQKQILKRLETTVRDRHQLEDDPKRVRKIPTLQEIALQILAEELEAAQAEQIAGDSRGSGEVVWTGLGKCHVMLKGTLTTCVVPPTFLEVHGTMPAIGDVAELKSLGDELRVSGLQPRRTILSRPDPAGNGRELVIAANVDIAVIVVSVVAPPLHPRILDRYLVAVQRGGVDPVIFVNKTDLLLDEDDWERERAKLVPYRALGVPIIMSSAIFDETAMRKLLELVSGRTCVLVGHSGVGKSSTINALAPDLNLNTGDVWAGYGRGTHTTTASSLHDIGGGTRLIDTPGVRSFGIFDVTADELQWYFPEFLAHVQDCKYRDCSHSHEPHCGVRAAANGGEISMERFETYLRMREEL